MLPWLQSLVAKLCSAAVAIGDAWLAYNVFRTRHCEAAFEFFAPPDVELLTNDPRLPYSRVRQFIRGAVEAGHVPTLTIPPAWNEPVAPTSFASQEVPKPKRTRMFAR
jgi:hypothetical protein